MSKTAPDPVTTSASTVRTIRALAAAVVVAAVALVANGLFISRNEPALKDDPAAAYAFYEDRFAPLKDALPATGSVGYFNNLQDQTRPYYLARYVLAPTRILYETPCEIAIGDFYPVPRGYPGKDVNAILRDNGYSVERNFKDGLYLLRRKPGPAPAKEATP